MFNFHKGSALLISFFVVMLICIIVIFLLDKIVPISKNLKGIENSNIAYYYANSGIEEVLLSMSGSNPGYETGSTIGSISSTGITYSVTASGTTIPASGKGNSTYDKDYNKIGRGNPLQLLINQADLSDFKIQFKVPDLGWKETLGWENDPILSGPEDGSQNGTGMILWILSGISSAGTGISLTASGEDNMITRDDINNSGTINIFEKFGFTGAGTEVNFETFYNSLSCSNSKPCSLKFSIISTLEINFLASFPFLEYKITGLDSPIPLQIANINSDGYSYGFKRSINKKIKQITTSEVLDYAVFQ